MAKKTRTTDAQLDAVKHWVALYNQSECKVKHVYQHLNNTFEFNFDFGSIIFVIDSDGGQKHDINRREVYSPERLYDLSRY